MSERSEASHQGSGGTLVCFAMKEEAGAFQKLAARLGALSILVTGIGRDNSVRSVEQFLATRTPARTFTCGFAGGLDPSLKIGDVLYETTDTALAGKLSSVKAGRARFVCATRIATTTTEKIRLRNETDADAVEMESEAIQAICRARGIPCATVRAISDTAHDDLPLDFNQLANPDLSLNYGKLALALARSPGKIPALLRLQKHSKFAAERLAVALARVCGEF